MHAPRREGESLMDYAIRTMDSRERAEAKAAGEAAVERIMRRVREERDWAAEMERNAPAQDRPHA